jgi:peptidoglycan/xylan/chitin deacetylase (PgdA/CDA1 family)
MDELLRFAKPVSADRVQRLEAGIHHVAVTFDDGYLSAVENALPELALREIPSTMFIQTGYLGKHPLWIQDDHHPLRKEIVVNLEQLKQISSKLVSIGSHCVSHRNLVLLSKDESKNELEQSKRYLESVLNRGIELLSFPHGAYNRELIELALSCGYKHVFTILPTFAFREPGEFVTGRISVTPSDWRIEFRLKLLGAYCWLPLAFKLKQKLYIIHKHPNHQGRMYYQG